MLFIVTLQLPELTRDVEESCNSKCFSLVLDIIGLSLGVTIMTFIAFYEDTIQLLLANQWHHAVVRREVIVSPPTRSTGARSFCVLTVFNLRVCLLSTFNGYRIVIANFRCAGAWNVLQWVYMENWNNAKGFKSVKIILIWQWRIIYGRANTMTFMMLLKVVRNVVNTH